MTDDLIIDLRSSAAQPTEMEVRDWASEQRIFISSVVDDLRQERKAVADAVSALGAEPIYFEEFGGRDSSAKDAYISEVRSSSVYVGILGHRYGDFSPGDRLSATHAEYRAAEEAALRICVWTSAEHDWLRDQQAFVNEVRAFHTTNDFESKEDLANRVNARLRQIAAEELSPWCKVGNVIFRAAEVEDDGAGLTLTAVIREPAVLAALKAVRPGTWSPVWGPPTRSITVNDQSGVAEVKKVSTKTKSRFASTVQIHLGPLTIPSPNRPFDLLGFRSYSREELIELKVRNAAFGEATLNGTLITGGISKDPLEPIRKAGLPEETLRGIAHLLWTEALVGTGQASAVIKLLLSSPVNGSRLMRLEWQPTSTGVPPRSVEGTVRL